MTTVYALLNADAKAWWYHAALRARGEHAEARELERRSIRSGVRSLREAVYVSVGRGGHTVHRTGYCTVQGYEGLDGPTVQAAIRLGIPVISTLSVPDSDAFELIGLPMVAVDSSDLDREPWHSMSYVPLAFYAGLAQALGATVLNLEIDPAQGVRDLAAWRAAREARRAEYEARKAAEEAAVPAAPLEFRFPRDLNLPRADGSRRLMHDPAGLCAALAEAEGYRDFGELVAGCELDSCVPGICWLCRSYVTEVEPDQSEGYCETCGEGSVIAATEIALAL